MKAFVTLGDRGNFLFVKPILKYVFSYIMCSDCDNYQIYMNLIKLL